MCGIFVSELIKVDGYTVNISLEQSLWSWTLGVKHIGLLARCGLWYLSILPSGSLSTIINCSQLLSYGELERGSFVRTGLSQILKLDKPLFEQLFIEKWFINLVSNFCIPSFTWEAKAVYVFNGDLRALAPWSKAKIAVPPTTTNGCDCIMSLQLLPVLLEEECPTNCTTLCML